MVDPRWYVALTGIPVVVFGTSVFIRYRHRWPLSDRAPMLNIVMSFCVVVLDCMLLSEPTTISNDYPCSVITPSFFAIIPVTLFTWVLKTWLLLFKFEITHDLANAHSRHSPSIHHGHPHAPGGGNHRASHMSPAQLMEASYTMGDYKMMSTGTGTGTGTGQRSVIGVTSHIGSGTGGIGAVTTTAVVATAATATAIAPKGTVVAVAARSSFVDNNKHHTDDGSSPSPVARSLVDGSTAVTTVTTPTTVTPAVVTVPPPKESPSSPKSPKVAPLPLGFRASGHPPPSLPPPSSTALVMTSSTPMGGSSMMTMDSKQQAAKEAIYRKYSTASSKGSGSGSGSSSRYEIGWFTLHAKYTRWQYLGPAVIGLALWTSMICIIVLFAPGRDTLCRDVPRRWWYVTFADTLGLCGLQGAIMLILAAKLKKFGNDALGVRNEIMMIVGCIICYGAVVYPGLNAAKSGQYYLWCSIAILIHFMWALAVAHPLIMAFRVWRREAKLAHEIQTMGGLADLLKIPVAAQCFAKFVSAQFVSESYAFYLRIQHFKKRGRHGHTNGTMSPTSDHLHAHHAGRGAPYTLFDVDRVMLLSAPQPVATPNGQTTKNTSPLAMALREAHSIYRSFVEEQSPFQVNLSATLRKKIGAELQRLATAVAASLRAANAHQSNGANGNIGAANNTVSPPMSPHMTGVLSPISRTAAADADALLLASILRMYDEAEAEILHLMETNVYKRFLSSKAYKTLIADLQQHDTVTARTGATALHDTITPPIVSMKGAPMSNMVSGYTNGITSGNNNNNGGHAGHGGHGGSGNHATSPNNITVTNNFAGVTSIGGSNTNTNNNQVQTWAIPPPLAVSSPVAASTVRSAAVSPTPLLSKGASNGRILGGANGVRSGSGASSYASHGHNSNSHNSHGGTAVTTNTTILNHVMTMRAPSYVLHGHQGAPPSSVGGGSGGAISGVSVSTSHHDALPHGRSHSHGGSNGTTNGSHTNGDAAAIATTINNGTNGHGNNGTGNNLNGGIATPMIGMDGTDGSPSSLLLHHPQHQHPHAHASHHIPSSSYDSSIITVPVPLST